MDNWSFIDTFEDFYDIASHKSEDYEKFVYIVGNKKDLYSKGETIKYEKKQIMLNQLKEYISYFRKNKRCDYDYWIIWLYW